MNYGLLFTAWGIAGIIGPIVGRFDPLELPGRSPPLLDEFCPDPFPAYGPQ